MNTIVILLLPIILSTTYARKTTCIANMQIFHYGVIQFQHEYGRLPSPEEGLQALIKMATDWPKYMEWQKELNNTEKIPKDPWGNKYRYLVHPRLASGFIIYSIGPYGLLYSNMPSEPNYYDASIIKLLPVSDQLLLEKNKNGEITFKSSRRLSFVTIIIGLVILAGGIIFVLGLLKKSVSQFITDAID